MKKIIGIVAALLVTTLLAINVLVKAADVPASVTVPSVCGITVNWGSPIAFLEVTPGTESTAKVVEVENTGNVPTTDFKVYGINWAGATYTMPVGQTKVSESGAIWNDLLVSPGSTLWGGVLVKGSKAHPQFKVAIPTAQNPDTYSQTITFTVGC